MADADKNPNWTMTNGNHRARGWTQNDEGNWIPSLHDRRRMATNTIQAVAEVSPGGEVHGPVIFSILKSNSTTPKDFEKMIQMFQTWATQ